MDTATSGRFVFYCTKLKRQPSYERQEIELYEWAPNEDYQSIFKQISVHDVVRFYPNLEGAAQPTQDNDALFYYVNSPEVAVLDHRIGLNLNEITIDADQLTLKTDTGLMFLMYRLWTLTVVAELDQWGLR